MNRKMLGVFTLVAIFLSPQIASAATVGKTCTKVGQTSGSGAMKLTCKKISGKLKWTSTPVKEAVTPKPSPSAVAAKAGSFSMPIEGGIYAQVGDFKYKIDGARDNLSEQVCADNGFNQGCTYDDNLNRIVDPMSTGRWIALNVSAINTGNQIATPGGFLTTFQLVLPNGKLLTSYSNGLKEELDYSGLIPGGQASGIVAFYLDKSIQIPDLAVIRDQSSFLSDSTLYFKVPK